MVLLASTAASTCWRGTAAGGDACVVRTRPAYLLREGDGLPLPPPPPPRPPKPSRGSPTLPRRRMREPAGVGVPVRLARSPRAPAPPAAPAPLLQPTPHLTRTPGSWDRFRGRRLRRRTVNIGPPDGASDSDFNGSAPGRGGASSARLAHPPGGAGPEARQDEAGPEARQDEAGPEARLLASPHAHTPHVTPATTTGPEVPAPHPRTAGIPLALEASAGPGVDGEGDADTCLLLPLRICDMLSPLRTGVMRRQPRGMCIQIHATKLSSPGSCGASSPCSPCCEVSVPRSRLYGTARFPGHDPGLRRLSTAGGVSGNRTRDLAVWLHKSLWTYHSAICADSGVVRG